MKIRKFLALTVVVSFSVFSFLNVGARQQVAEQTAGTPLGGLRANAQVVRSADGVPHIYAQNDRDLYFMMGYIHAQDRFFQMDLSRRQASGTLAELLGPGPNDQILASDTLVRQLSLRRAAELSRAAYSPSSLAHLQAYAEGVNRWLDDSALPPEYAALELTKAGVPRWDTVDSIVISKSITFSLSFDIGDLVNFLNLTFYQVQGVASGFDGTKLFFEDVCRRAPFDRTVSIPGQQNNWPAANPNSYAALLEQARRAQALAAPATLSRVGDFLKRASANPLFNRSSLKIGSNWWVVGGAKSASGYPLLANDPHLGLGSPSIFYENHLLVEGGESQPPMNVYGVSFPGVPGVIIGFNDRIQWGVTTSSLDMSDIYLEQVVVNPLAQNSAFTRYRATLEPLTAIPETYRVNRTNDGTGDNMETLPAGSRPSGVSVPPYTYLVPRRANGPLLNMSLLPPPGGLALPLEGPGFSIQFTGFSATREIEAPLSLARARNVEDFKRSLQFFASGALNWSYADVDGNSAYFISGELPLREDLQAGKVEGLPPFFVRDGSGTFRNEWIRNDSPPPGQSIPFQILPFAEKPSLVNPPRGFIVNANNDPVGASLDNDVLNQLRVGGNGIYYLAPRYDGGFRVGQITKLIERGLDAAQGGGKLSLDDMKRIQSNVQMLDAEVLTPYITRALAAGRKTGAPPELAALAHDPALAEAASRLANWDFSTPTGIPEGFDAGDLDGQRQEPTPEEVSRSVAATIYSVWRGQIIKNTIDATLGRVGLGGNLPDDGHSLTALRNLLDNFEATQGRGASGLNFFDVGGVNLTASAERDIIILQSLKEGLSLLSGEGFAAAFGGSSRQSDYRWGKLHRIVFAHPLGAANPSFNIPTGGGFVDLAPGLPGISTDGGWQVIDQSAHGARAATVNGFMYGGGAARRFVGEARPDGIRAEEVIPGGQSGVPGTELFGSQLGLWLTNDFHRAFTETDEVKRHRESETNYRPEKRKGR